MVETILGTAINIVVGGAVGGCVEVALLNNLPKVATKTGKVIMGIGVAGAGITTSWVVGDYVEEQFHNTVDNLRIIKNEVQEARRIRKELKRELKAQNKLEKEMEKEA